MTYQASRLHGQPIGVAPRAGELSADKWAIVEDLTVAAASFGLSHRSIAVLRVMLTFVPDRILSALPGRMVVFASNDALATRLGGMPESTLRRHLAALVDAGVVARIDSPNRKRYAKRMGHAIACAFGFDLAPLARLATTIHTEADSAKARAAEHDLLRHDVLIARQTLCAALTAQGIDPQDIHAHSPLLARTRLMVRHKDNLDALRALLDDYKIALSALKMNTSDSQNERHQQRDIYKKIPSQPSAKQLTAEEHHSDVVNVDQFGEYRRMFSDTAQNWMELNQHARLLTPMMGVDISIFDEARRVLGPKLASIAILAMLERFDSLKNPSGFLNTLIQRARGGRMNMARLLAEAGILSADNNQSPDRDQNTCQ